MFCKIYKSTCISEVEFRCSDSPADVKTDVGKLAGDGGTSEIPLML